MIVRLLEEGQFRVDDGIVDELNELDRAAADALGRDDEDEFRRVVEELAQRVRSRGEPLGDADLSASDAIVPPADLSLDEARRLFSGEEGLIPDLTS